MHLPETTKQIQGLRRQRVQSILVAFGIADMHALMFGIDIAHLQPQALAETQAQTIDGEKEHPITEGAGCQEQTLGFINGDDIRQTLGSGRLDKMGRHPGFAQHMGNNRT